MPGFPLWLDIASVPSKGISATAKQADEELAAKEPPKAPVEPKEMPGVASDFGGSEAFNQDVDAGLSIEKEIYNFPQQEAAAPGVPVPAQEEEWKIGGKGTLNKLFKQDPERTAEAIRQGAEAVEQEGQQTANFYAQEREKEGARLAAYEAHRLENQQGIAQRQQEIDQAIKKYSTDLADTGQFWRNPGNIIAAFGAAIMDMGNRENTGWKMIQAAVNNDLENRRHIAGMHLGELRSNLHGYRQLAQDKEAGDLLANAEAYRIGALQLKEISGRFAGKKARATAETYISEMMQKSDALWSEWYSKAVLREPHIGQKVLEDLRKKAGSQEIQPGNQAGPLQGEQPPELPPNPYGPEPIPPAEAAKKTLGAKTPEQIKAQLSQMGGSTAQAPAAPAKPKRTPEQIAALKMLLSKEAFDKLMASDEAPKMPEPNAPQVSTHAQLSGSEARVRGSTRAAMALNADLIARSKVNGVPNKAKFDAIRKDDDAQYATLGSNEHLVAASLTAKSTAKLLSEMSVVEAACRKYGIDPDDFLGKLRPAVGGPIAGRIRQITNNRAFTGKAGSKEEAEDRALLQASEDLHQKMALNIVTYLASQGGKALTEEEIKQYSQVVGTGDNWARLMRGFRLLNGMSNEKAETMLSSNRRVRLRWKADNGLNIRESDYQGLQGAQ